MSRQKNISFAPVSHEPINFIVPTIVFFVLTLRIDFIIVMVGQLFMKIL